MVFIFIFSLFCQSSQFSTGQGQHQGELFISPSQFVLNFYYLDLESVETPDTDIDTDSAAKQQPIADIEDVSEEKQNDEEMKFNSIFGDYYPDYDEYLSQHLYHGGCSQMN